MSCLFGYCGCPSTSGLLKKMADTLSHRCPGGWEKVTVSVRKDYIVEIGRGIPRWSSDTQVFHIPDKSLAYGYAGVLHDIKALDGAYVMASVEGDDFSLIRDPSGIKALYWTMHNGRLLFASEIKALFADHNVPRQLRPGAIAEYLTFSYIPGQRTMFEGIEELQPGTILKFNHGKTSLKRYFVFEEKEQLSQQGISQEREYAEAVRSTLEKGVKRYCNLSQNPPAVFLSGGIDSSAVLAVTARHFSETPIKTFSIHFGEDYANENEFISLMVGQYKTDHTWLEVQPKTFLRQLRQIVWYLDDPIGDPVTVPNYLLAREASTVTDIALNGEGGDPCFGGPKNIPMMLGHVYGSSDNSALCLDYLMSYRRCFSNLRQLLDPSVYKNSGGEEALIEIIAPFLRSPMPKSFLNKLMSINIRLKGANLILVKVDKMTSANGLLALPPLFTKEMIETSMSCPPELKLKGNIEKYILKQAVTDIVPQPIIQRPKSGMRVPVRFWFRGEMKRYAKKVLSKKSLNRMGIFNPKVIENLLNYKVEEMQSFRHGLTLWMLITFMLWYEQFVEEI